MAIDHRILQSITSRDNTNVLNMFQNSLNAQLNRDVTQGQIDQRRVQTDILGQQRDFANRPETQLLLEQGQQQEIAQVYAQSLRPLLESGNVPALLQQLEQNKARLTQLGIPTTGVDEDIAQAQTAEGLEQLRVEVNETLTGATGRQVSVSQREFNSNVASVKADPNLETVEGKAAAVALGIEARASTSANERIAVDPVLSSAVAVSQAEIEGAKSVAREGGKLKQQLKHKPSITKAVKLAEKEATERGEVLTDLARMEASLPGIREVVNELVELSSIATSTFAGRIFDSAVKESGFGSTKGADAKAKLIAIVDNQVLPLLKETFGAAFTVQEGENLKASLVDPNSSPAEKRAQLDAFIAQKERNIRTKQSQLDAGQAAQPTTVIRFDAQGNQVQ